MLRVNSLLVVIIISVASVAWSQPSSQPTGPLTIAPSPPPPPSTTKTGSFAPGVYLEDITYTIRGAYPRALTVSKHNPQVAYVGSWEGYVWKTTDGGKTWDESRLIIEPRPFHGDSWQRLYFGTHRSSRSAWRPRHKGMGSIVPWPIAGSSKSSRGASAQRIDSSTGTRISTAYGPPGVRQRRRNGDHRHYNTIDPGAASRAGAGGNSNFGIGLPGGAPRLQMVVRKFGKPTSGLNIKQTLLLRGVRPTEVRLVVIHPNNPKIVFACTMFGLYMTYDGGLNWIRTFQGINPRGRQILHVAVDPQNEQRVFLGTGNGLYISTDGGNNYIKSTSQGVGEGYINWIYFNPTDSRYIIVGTGFGVLRSKDGGDSWDWIYFTTFPPARIVRGVVIDPFDKKTGYIATHDGLFYTPNILTGSLESWKRMGGLRFTGMEMSKIEVCPKHKGHIWALSNMSIASVKRRGLIQTGGAFIWETIDGGDSWKVIYAGNTQGSMQWFDIDPVDPDMLWITWSRSMMRMRRKKPGQGSTLTPAQEAKVLKAYNEDKFPTLSEVIFAAFRYIGIEPDMQLKYRRLSTLKALIPRVDISYTRLGFNDYPVLFDGLYPTLPFFGRAEVSGNLDEFRMMLSWDLSSLAFNLKTTMFGRVDRVSEEIRHYLRFNIHRFYPELKRLRFMMMMEPPEDLRIRVIYKLRIEELEHYVNFLTGGYLERYKKGDRPRGVDTPWFEPWASK